MLKNIYNVLNNNKSIIISVLAITILLYLVTKLMYMQESNLIETFTSNNKNVKETIEGMIKQVKNTDKSLSEMLFLDKYKSNYEDLIIAVDELMDKALIFNLVSDLQKNKPDPTNAFNSQALATMNQYINFKENLNKVMDSLDKASNKQ
jgi:hypothetical protein